MSLSLKIILCSIGCICLGFLSGYFGGSVETAWYQNLVKPWFQPPGWLFGPVWTILYGMIGASIALIWHSQVENKSKAYLLFVVQFILNLIWSPIFFMMQNPVLALVVIVTLWVLLLLTISCFKKIDKLAGKLLIPYLFWISFATILNSAIVYLN